MTLRRKGTSGSGSNGVVQSSKRSPCSRFSDERYLLTFTVGMGYDLMRNEDQCPNKILR